MRDAVEIYLRHLGDIRATGAATRETSYYRPLGNLLNAIDDKLTPRVQCVLQLRNIG